MKSQIQEEHKIQDNYEVERCVSHDRVIVLIQQ